MNQNIGLVWYGLWVLPLFCDRITGLSFSGIKSSYFIPFEFYPEIVL